MVQLVHVSTSGHKLWGIQVAVLVILMTLPFSSLYHPLKLVITTTALLYLITKILQSGKVLIAAPIIHVVPTTTRQYSRYNLQLRQPKPWNCVYAVMKIQQMKGSSLHLLKFMFSEQAARIKLHHGHMEQY